MFRQLPKLKLGFKALSFQLTRHRCTAVNNMSDIKPATGIPLELVVEQLKLYANPSLAASWDNVGLLIEPTEAKNVAHILLTNDLTEDVMQEALDLNVDLIISYHPPIFASMKTVTTKSWKERIVAKCLENRIAVYSPHTTFDSVKGGVNDWLASAFEHVLSTCKPIEENKNEPTYGMGRLLTLNEKISADAAVEYVKQLTDLQYVRLARARGTDGFIRTIALCAGSGVSVLKNVSADLYLTGEMLHHDVLEAVHNGTNVILTNHSDSERGFLKLFAVKLSNLLNATTKSVNVSVSNNDVDPLKTV